MVSEKLKYFFKKVKVKLEEIDPKELVKYGVKKVAGAIPIAGPIIKDVMEDLSPDKKEEILKEIRDLSESQFIEISENLQFSIEYIKNVRQLTLYTFKELRADHEEIIKLIESLIGELKPSVTLPTLESALNKGEITSGEFFRNETKWIDFEDDFIFERKEVNEILNKLENKNIQLVLGKPASGKSVILKNIGFKLAKRGYIVYLIELKKWSANRIESYFEEALKINDDKTLIIVDDAHLQIYMCEGMIRDFRYKKLRTNLIIGTREVKELLGSRKETSEFESLIETEISSIDATKDIVEIFLKKKHSISDEYRIKAISQELEEYKHDLWYLSWILMEYDKETNTIDKEEIYSAIHDDCIINIKGREKTIDGQDILLPLSIFFRFEIPIKKEFLTEILEIKENDIQDLLDISEIHEFRDKVEKIPMLSLHHSSLASLYFETYQRYHALGKNIKNRILKQSKYNDIEQSLFYLYLKSEPNDLLNVLILLGSNWIDEKEPIFIEELIEVKEIKDSIEKAIEKEKDIDNIGWCVKSIAEVSYKVAHKIVDLIDIDTLSSKINKEENIERIGWCIRDIARISKEVGQEIIDLIDIDIFSSKINKEGNIGKIAICLNGITRVSKIVSNKIVNLIDIVDLSSKINKEKDIGIIGWCISVIARVNKEIAQKIVNLIDIDVLSSKINKEKKIEEIGLSVDAIAEANKEVAYTIVNLIDIDILSSKINKEENIGDIGDCVLGIAEVNKEVAHKIVNLIDIDALSSKINKEENIIKIGSCIEDIAKASKKVALKLVNILSTKINKEENLSKIGWCIDGISEVDNEVAHKITNLIDIDVLSSKINKEKDMEKIGDCIRCILKTNEEEAQKIVNLIDIDALSSKINKEEDIFAIEWCVSVLIKVEKKIGSRIINKSPKVKSIWIENSNNLV